MSTMNQIGPNSYPWSTPPETRNKYEEWDLNGVQSYRYEVDQAIGVID